LDDDHFVAAIGVEVDETGDQVLENAVVRKRGDEYPAASRLRAQLGSFQIVAEHGVPVAPGRGGKPCSRKIASAVRDPAMWKLIG
jgi:hypothetical protein